MKDSEHIRPLSRKLRALATAAMVALPCMVLWNMAGSMVDPSNLASAFPILPASTTLSASKALLVGLVGALMLVPALFALWQMRLLFGRYLSGDVLSEACAEHIRKIGTAFVALACLGVAIPTAQILILTADSPKGEHLLSIAISSDSLGFLMAGGLITVIGWAMSGAARAAEENAGFI